MRIVTKRIVVDVQKPLHRFSSESRTRTCELWVMSPAAYHWPTSLCPRMISSTGVDCFTFNLMLPPPEALSFNRPNDLHVALPLVLFFRCWIVR
jgi:hypothetical protein